MNNVFAQGNPSALFGTQPAPNHGNNQIILSDGTALSALPSPAPLCKEGDEQLFMRHAFLFWQHRQRILSDSQLFLAPIDATHNLSFTGSCGFRRPTIGVYVEWWMMCEKARVDFNTAQPKLVCHIAGSALSGANHCTAVDERGEKTTVCVAPPFYDLYRPFVELNTRYAECGKAYEHYSLAEAIEMLAHK